MNSEFEELSNVWRQQPTPPAARSADGVLREVRDAERRWNAEWATADRGSWWMFGLMLCIVATDLIRGHGVDWPSAFLGAVWAWWIILSLWFRRQRRLLDRAGDVPLTGQFEKLHRLIAYRRRMTRLQLLGLPLLGVAIGAVVWSMSGQRSTAITAGAGSLFAVLLLARYQQRKLEAHFAERWRSVEQLAREIETQR